MKISKLGVNAVALVSVFGLVACESDRIEELDASVVVVDARPIAVDASPSDAGDDVTCEDLKSEFCPFLAQCGLATQDECENSIDCADNNGCGPASIYHPTTARRCVDAVQSASCETLKTDIQPCNTVCS